jgi:acetoin utilization protein AcuB
MTKGLATLSPDDRIDIAIEVFRENILHAIPVVENDELVGLITTHDIIEALAK